MKKTRKTNEVRKEVKTRVFKNVSKLPLDEDEFKMYTNQLFYIDDVQTLFRNQRRASTVNNIIKNDPLFAEISRLRRIENLEYRENENEEGVESNTKKEVAKLIKQALFNQINKIEPIEEKDIEEYVSKLANEKYNQDASAQVFELFETDRLKDIEKYLETMPIYNWCKRVRGLGTKLSAKLIAGIGDIQRFKNPGKLLAYCGVGDAEREKRKKGQMLTHNPKMRSILYNVSESFIKSNSQYRRIYDERKAKTRFTHPEWHNLNVDGTPNEGKNMHPKHADKDAKRVMIKRFLCELFDAWYRSIGVEVPTKPFIVEQPGHTLEPQIVAWEE